VECGSLLRWKLTLWVDMSYRGTLDEKGDDCATLDRISIAPLRPQQAAVPHSGSRLPQSHGVLRTLKTNGSLFIPAPLCKRIE